MGGGRAEKGAGGEGLHSSGYRGRSEIDTTDSSLEARERKRQSWDAGRGSPALSVGVENRVLLYTIAVSPGGTPSALSGASVLPLPPKPCALCGLVPGCRGAEPYGPDVTGWGGGEAGGWGRGVTSPGSAPRRAPSPALFCSGIAAGGGSEGAGHQASRQRDGSEEDEGPRGAEGPAVILRGGPGLRVGWGAAGGSSSGRTSEWKRALSRPPWLWGCPPRKHLPAT